MNITNILTASGLALAVSLIGLTAIAPPASAHPCFGNTASTFTCLDPDGEEGTFACVGTYDDDNANGRYDHDEEDTYFCSNGQT